MIKIKFADERINEYHSGNFHAVNTGQTIEVTPDIAATLFEAKHLLDAEFVPVFVKADAKPDEAKSDAKTAKKAK